jgi:tetratricopeptide (TPR) repeat protein
VSAPSPRRSRARAGAARFGGRCVIPRARSLLAISVLAGAAALTANPRVALADPSVWAKARDPSIAREASALVEAETLVRKYRHLQRQQVSAAFRDMGLFFLKDARRILESAGAATSRDPTTRYRLAEVLSDLGDHEKAAKLYEYALRSPSLLPPLRASGFTELAICYARLGRPQDEIKAYDDALALETIGPLRAMILANRAEANMVLGDITKAIEGYRASLGSLLAIEMFSFGVTTLWGLAVALDRSGDLESALGSIRLARDYDPGDKLITGPGWFYVPDYDADWYAALGYWSRARQATLGMSRAEAYERAIDFWKSYIERAPDADRWQALAKVRLRACERERDAAAAAAKARPETGALSDENLRLFAPRAPSTKP